MNNFPPDPRFPLGGTMGTNGLPKNDVGNDGWIAVDPVTGILYVKALGQWAVLSPGSAAPYKIYRALLSQSGTDAPVATVLENTPGGVPVFTRNSNGSFQSTLAGAFPYGKTHILAGNDFFISVGYLVEVEMNPAFSPDLFYFEMYDLAGVLQDTFRISIQILVYP